MFFIKRYLPTALAALAFAAILFLSFKHQPAPLQEEMAAATPQERLDQLSLSAAHTEPGAAQTPGPALSGISAVREPSLQDQAKLALLDQLLAAKNDNDPRLDQDFKQLTPEAKHLIRRRYATTPAEKRNQRGTIVYLLGRELQAPDDVAFLRSVLNEPPCLSLTNCTTEDRGSMGSGDHDHDGMNEVTLAYPQLTALKAIETYLNQPSAGALSAQVLAELEAARHSRVAKVAALAETISREYHAKHP